MTTQIELEAILDRWQRRLRLQAWYITVRLVGEQRADVMGWAEILGDHLRAAISVVDPEVIGDTLLDTNLELTLVHELLHVFLHQYGMENPEEDHGEERCINVLADVLVSLAGTSEVLRRIDPSEVDL